MSSEEHKQVEDEDRTVDRKIKDAILDARKRVEEREDLVFTRTPLNPEMQRISRPEQVYIWQTSVVQYLERIEPLLKSDQIERSDYYYHEVEIADRSVYPPDGETPVLHDGDVSTEEIQWSLFQSDQLSKRDIVNTSDIFELGFEPPEPRRFNVSGLKEVIEKPSRTFQWEVVLNQTTRRGNRDRKIARPEVKEALKKDELKLAVRLADEFLQDHAGIGLELAGGDQEAGGTYEDIVENGPPGDTNE